MEAILHMENLPRSLNKPLNIGHNDYIFYGESGVFGDEDDHIETPAATTRLGSPLQDIDHGNTRSHFPLVKTL